MKLYDNKTIRIIRFIDISCLMYIKLGQCYEWPYVKGNTYLVTLALSDSRGSPFVAIYYRLTAFT